ncbi:FAD-dependent oxidoreductase [Gordonia sp. L191]|uniref:FAD-dependent oxidoreductase n=1 Tax=Gordonia sp. L191 TaxID=2982699 RepID=UPI0024BF935A|nr:FAD-dependent oxidoreductase [Gordonia sp. L191]WHU47731.1 FAD-dependent oxidoreductase [Gordonia sp. L191]
MAAAHELSTRGFKVTVYERHSRLGGMVRAYTNPLGTSANPFEMSAQHFVLPSYAIVPETLRSIPNGRGGTVFDSLALIPRNPNVGAGNQGQRAPVTVGTTQFIAPLPLTPEAVRSAPIERYPQYISDALGQLGKYTPADTALLASKFAAWVTSGPRRSVGQLDKMTLRQFFRTDRMSANAAWLPWTIEHVLGSDAKDVGGSAEALKEFFVDPLFRTLESRDRYYWGLNIDAESALPLGICFDGPETEVWFDPWARHMRTLGAEFKVNHTLTQLRTDGGQITSAIVRDERGRAVEVTADYYVLAVPGDRMRTLFTPDITRADPGLRDAWNVLPAYETGFQLWFRELDITLGLVAPENGWYTFLGGVNTIWQRDLRKFGSGQVGGALDIEIFSSSLFQVPGRLFGKPMLQLTKEQTIAELRDHLIRHAGMAEAFRPGNFLGWTPHTTLQWTNTGWDVTDVRAGDAPGNAGRRPRPSPTGALRNLFLAGGSVRNSTFVDSQESAMETARRSVNAILERSGVNEPKCWLPDYSPPKALAGVRADDDRRYAAGLPNIFDVIAPAPRL